MSPEFGPGPEFLKQKYDLHNSPEVDSAVEKAEHQTGEELPNDPDIRIQAYLDRLEHIINPPKLEGHENFDRKERNVEMLKKAILDKFITKPEEVSQNYELFLQEVIEERGMRGDWDAASDEQKKEMMTEQIQAVLEDQKGSLEIWIDYLASDDAMYPDWLKYWAFRSILGLSEYNKEQKKFPKRSKGTVKMFPDLNYEALAYTLDAINKKYTGEAQDIPYDIQEDEKTRFNQFLKNENFANLYAWSIENINPIDEELLQVTDGEWMKYDQGSDPKILVESIRGKGTGWCTAGETTAKKQLNSGDFYVFYSNDQENNPTIPRVAIRMEGDKIAEVRGIAYKQNLDPFVGEVLTEKLEEFPDKDEYLKKEHDMARLTEIKNKTQTGEELTRSDQVFLYEVDSKIQGFGYRDDPRIKELRAGRNIEDDMLVIFDCQKEQIARRPEQISENTKAYIGQLYPQIFNQLVNIEHIYTSFPEGKISRSELTVGGLNEEQLQSNLNEICKRPNGEVNISTYSQDKLDEIYRSPQFAHLIHNPEQIALVRLKVRDLGDEFKNGATTEQIYARAEELGLELCPDEVGPYQRIKDTEQPLGNWYSIAMKQFTDRDGGPDVFDLEHREDGLWLNDNWARPGFRWSPGHELMFRLRKVSQET